MRGCGPASGDWEREDETHDIGAWRWDWGEEERRGVGVSACGKRVAAARTHLLRSLGSATGIGGERRDVALVSARETSGGGEDEATGS